MKSLKVLPALFLSSALLTTACTPQDIEVGKPDVMAKIDRPKGTKKKPIVKQYGNPNAFDFGNFSTASVMMEKQIEAIELLQIVLGNTDVAKTLYTITDMGLEKGIQTYNLKSVKDELAFSNKLGNITGTFEKDIKAYVKTHEKVEKTGYKKNSIVFMGSNIYKSNGAGDPKTRSFLNTFETYELVVSEFPGDSSILNVRISTEGNFNYRAGKGFQKADFNYQSSFIIDRASLKESEVKVYDSTMNLDLGTKRVNVAATDFTVKIDGRCNELIGSANISMGRGKTKEISFDKETIKVTDTDWEQKLATCGQRPTVDVMRLLVY
ncbi:hypothetical protein [Bdellovibrio sp. HCB274]|uniref:hypothetical protein n=1 Tax=Bdellovibrio sp. HCB274 TaxID=3394361 RepID=UPI0039B39A0D